MDVRQPVQQPNEQPTNQQPINQPAPIVNQPPQSKKKIRTYSIIFFLISLLHIFIGYAFYIKGVLPITASIGLIILGLLFHEIYKKYKSVNFSPYLLISLIIVWGLLFINQIVYIPSKIIVITDIFGKPVEGISVQPVGYVGNLMFKIYLVFSGLGNFLSSEESIYPKDVYYKTNGNGETIMPSRFYFGNRMITIEMSMNHKDENTLFDYPKVSVRKNLLLPFLRERQIMLLPLKGDYKKCDSIADENNKNKCLIYTILSSAIEEKNSEICKLYDSSEVKNAIVDSQDYYLSGSDHIKNQCLVLVEGIINNNPEICKKIKNTKTIDYSNQCKCLFDSSYCTAYKDEVDDRRAALKTTGLHNYLCEGKYIVKFPLGDEIRYKNPSIRYLDSASYLYRKMFCD